jgi:hypothetical protein
VGDGNPDFNATLRAMAAENSPIPTLARPTATPTTDNTILAATVAQVARTVTALAAATQVAMLQATETSEASPLVLPETALPLTPETLAGTPILPPTDVALGLVSPTPSATLPVLLLPTPLPDPSLRSFELRGSGEGVVIQFPFEVGVVRFTRNPNNPNQYMTVTTAGTLVYIPDFSGGVATRIYASPFTDFTYQVRDRSENNAAVDDARWSPDGSTVAYIVNGNRESFDGVWLWSPQLGDLGQYIRDCPPEPGCQLVVYRENPAQWESRALQWSPDSRALIVTLWIPGEERFGFTIINTTQRNPERREPRWIAYRYNYAWWSLDSQRVIVSGRGGADSVVAIRAIDRQTGQETILYQAPGLWLQDAVDLPDGRIAFFGSTGERNPVTMFTYDPRDGTVRTITPVIGVAGPERILWNAARTAALVVTAEEYNSVFYKRYYIAGIDGSVREITVEVGGALAVEWAS